MLAEVGKLIDHGFAEQARNLAMHALDLLDEAGLRVDDSGGGLAEAIGQAEGINQAACSVASPDAVHLADYLVEKTLSSNYGIFSGRHAEYAELLGEPGRTRYRELVEDAWRSNPGSSIAKLLMEDLAEAEGGTAALVGVLSENVTSPYDVMRIAKLLVEDGRDDDALEWLTRGLAEYPPDRGLRSLAAECHLRAGRRSEAIELLWANFADLTE